MEELGVRLEDLVALEVVEHAEGVEAVLGEVAEAERGVDAILVLALGLAGAAADLEAAEVLAQDDVDHARDGVRAVDRGGAVLQHLDALDRAEDGIEFRSTKVSWRFCAKP